MELMEATSNNVHADDSMMMEDSDDMYDSDDDAELPAKESAQDYLRWRYEDEDSLSDWTIQVVTTTSTQPLVAAEAEATAVANDEDGGQGNVEVVKIYHAHKYVLAAGPRRSEYFARLFQHGFSESQNSTSRIELHELMAKAFPLKLDFLCATTFDGCAIYNRKCNCAICIGQVL